MAKVTSASDGFYLPPIYFKDQKAIESSLLNGDIDYADLTSWTFPDEFLCFVLQRKLLSFINRTFPNPRQRNDVPIWFLVSCQFIMRLHQSKYYHRLNFLLNSGSLLTRFGFNIGSQYIGFNEKNKKPRRTAIHSDTVRKFFKDTDPDEICRWYRQDLQKWFRQQWTFHHHGIFILDQSRLVVPDNPSYKDAVKMPVDEHGQLYKGLGSLTKEQKKGLVYHPCYTLSTLLNVTMEHQQFHVAGYELGPGNEDELVQANRLVPDFCRQNPGLMKLLIMDRGYIDGELISLLKKDYQVDSLLPLKRDMNDYQDAIALAQMKDKWIHISEEKDSNGHVLLKKEVMAVNDLTLWETLEVKLHACVTRYTYWNDATKAFEEKYSVLASTKKLKDPRDIVAHYELRVQIEERFRQFKWAWYISQFPSPHASLIESHVCFTLLTYSLLQLYLHRHDFQERTHQMIDTLRAEERLGKDAVLVYAKDKFGVFDLDDYTIKVAGMDSTPRQKLTSIMQAQKETRIKRES